MVISKEDIYTQIIESGNNRVIPIFEDAISLMKANNNRLDQQYLRGMLMNAWGERIIQQIPFQFKWLMDQYFFPITNPVNRTSMYLEKFYLNDELIEVAPGIKFQVGDRGAFTFSLKYIF